MRKYISVILSASLIAVSSGCMSRESAPETSKVEEHSNREEPQPTAEGCTLPVLNYGAGLLSLSHPFETYYNEMKWGNEYDRIFNLGNCADYSGEDWLSLIPQDGTPVKIKATVGNIKAEYLRDSHKSGNGYYRAEIQALELV